MKYVLITTPIKFGGTGVSMFSFTVAGRENNFANVEEITAIVNFTDGSLVDKSVGVSSKLGVIRNVKFVRYGSSLALALPMETNECLVFNNTLIVSGVNKDPGLCSIVELSVQELESYFTMEVVTTSDSQSSGYLVGQIIYYPRTMVPDDYIGFDGQAFDKVAFPKLAKLFPEGVMPNYNGKMLKGALTPSLVGTFEEASVGPLSLELDDLPPHNHPLDWPRNSGSGYDASGSIYDNCPSTSVTHYGTDTSSSESPTGYILNQGGITAPQHTLMRYITLAG